MWNSSSSSMSARTSARMNRRYRRQLGVSPISRATSAGLFGGCHHLPDDGHITRPALGLGAELASPAGGEPIELRLAVVLRESPLGLDEATCFHAVERRVQRRVLDAELTIGGLSQPAEDVVPMHGAPGEGLEDEHVEGALEDVDFSRRHRFSTKRLSGG